MSRRAWVYIWAVLIAAALLSGLAFPAMTVPTWQWLTFAAFTLFATLSQFFEAEAPGRQSYYPHTIFFFAGVLLLHPFLFALLILVPHITEWAKARIVNSAHLRAWYIQPFNISVHVIAGLSASFIRAGLDTSAGLYLTPASVGAVTLAAFVYVLLNHIFIGLALVLARGISWRESGVLEFENLLTDFIMIYLGYVVAVLWLMNLILIIPALSPLVLMYRALMIPALKQQAQTDSKTGLLNAQHFASVFALELERAKRMNRPLAVIMADLDLLRNINNTYGHLAGDAVLSGIGAIIRKTIRDNDIAGRFGGEEFAILLPDVGSTEAQTLAERIRVAIEVARFEVATSPALIGATMSLGIACFPADANTTTALVQAADVAVYQAKLNGRNRVVLSSEMPHSLKLEETAAADQAPALPTAAFATSAEPPSIPRGHVATGSISEQASKASPIKAAPARSFGHVWLLVGGVIATSLGLTILGLAYDPRLDLTALLMLATLAISAELLQIDLYGTGTISVSVAIAFAAALITGIPGVVGVSAAIAIGAAIARARGPQQRPPWYKTAYNWATHVLAGAVPALLVPALGLQLDVAHLASLTLPIAIAAMAYYAIDTTLIAAAISMSSGTRLFSTWRQQFRWLAGHYLALCLIGLFLTIAYAALNWPGLVVFALPVVMMRFAQQQYIARTEDSVRELKRLNHELTIANHEINDASKAIEQLNDELFLTLSKIIDARDPYASGHAAKVAEYAAAIAIDLELAPERIKQIHQAGLLHDIGKIGVSEQILHKPDKLTTAEYAQIKTHVTLGAELLETSHGLRHLAPFVRHHHERWDGAGYPHQLFQEQTPLEARILAVCDAVEAMASDRPYHRAMSLNEIIEEVKRCRGNNFDPTIVDIFVQIAEREGGRLFVNSAQEVMRKQTGNPRYSSELGALASTWK